MPQFVAKTWQSLGRRRWLILTSLVVVIAALTWAAPHLRAWYHLRAGRSAADRYHLRDARAHFDACLDVWPNCVEAHLLSARAARQAEDLDAARTHIRECQRLEGTPSPASVLEWSLLRAASGEIEEVEPYLRSAAGKDPAVAPLVWEALAAGCRRKYRLVDATNYLDDCLTSQPDNVQALFLRGAIRQKVGGTTQAIEDFTRVMELDPERDDARRLLARTLLRNGRYEDSLKHLERLQARSPNDPELLVNLARCQLELGRREEAQALLDRLLAEDTGNGPALQERGRLAMRASRPEEAEDWFRKAVKAMPLDYYANWQLAESLRLQGKTSDAEEQMERARQLQDRLERLGDIQARLMSQRPNDPALHAELGTLLLAMGEREQGKNWLLSALNLDDKCVPAHAALATLFEEQGDTENAARHHRLAQP